MKVARSEERACHGASRRQLLRARGAPSLGAGGHSHEGNRNLCQPPLSSSFPSPFLFSSQCPDPSHLLLTSDSITHIDHNTANLSGHRLHFFPQLNLRTLCDPHHYAHSEDNAALVRPPRFALTYWFDSDPRLCSHLSSGVPFGILLAESAGFGLGPFQYSSAFHRTWPYFGP